MNYNEITGRLHASEIDESLLDEGCRPADEFLRLHKGKIINIKVIGISKIKEVQRKGKGKLYSSISPAGQGKVVKVCLLLFFYLWFYYFVLLLFFRNRKKANSSLN